MSDDPESVVLMRLREIRDMLARSLEDTHDLRLRVGALEATSASVSLRLDRLITDMDHVQRRLGLIDQP